MKKPTHVANFIPERDRHSHVHADGTPKVVMTADQATAMAKKKGHVAYLCREQPTHYHVGKAQ